jgi:hypothetical protein
MATDLGAFGLSGQLWRVESDVSVLQSRGRGILRFSASSNGGVVTVEMAILTEDVVSRSGVPASRLPWTQHRKTTFG